MHMTGYVSCIDSRITEYLQQFSQHVYGSTTPDHRLGLSFNESVIGGRSRGFLAHCDSCVEQVALTKRQTSRQFMSGIT